MAQPYLDALKALVASEFSEVSGLMCKHFFSGAALYANKVICASLTPAGFACKLPEQRCSELILAGKASPLRYFEKSPIKKGYVLFPDNNKPTHAAQMAYLRESLAYVSTLDA